MIGARRKDFSKDALDFPIQVSKRVAITVNRGNGLRREVIYNHEYKFGLCYLVIVGPPKGTNCNMKLTLKGPI
jgi:hypothetical protein